MRKPDDDLKIDISELFGGDLPSPSETLEEAATVQSPTQFENANAPKPATESQFQDWMSGRNAELEEKRQELEKRLQETPFSQITQSSTPDILSSQELLATPVENNSETGVASPIDFNAPIAPPFMGTNMPPIQASTEEVSAKSGQETAPVESQNPEELKKLQAEYEFLMLYDEFRNIIVYELKDLVGERKTFTMLGRTVEMAREKHPEIFRNANWDAAGNLLEDGSVDSQRIIENKNSLDAQKADEVVDAALSMLLRLRLQALEKGLGAGLKNKVRARLYQWISEKTQKATREGKDTVNLKRLSGYVAST